MNLYGYLLALWMLTSSVSSKLLPYSSMKYPPTNLTSLPPPLHPGFLRIGHHFNSHLPPLHPHLLSSNLPMTLHPSPITSHVSVSGSPSPDLYWIPTTGSDGHMLPTGHRERGFFGKIRSFFTEMRVDPPRAFINSFDMFLGRLGEAIFHALVEIGLDFVLGFGRG